MKRILLLGLGVLLLNPVHAFTINEEVNNGSTSNSATVSSTQFALSGTVNKYRPKKSIIFINSVKYKISGEHSLTKKQLKKGQVVKFNTEKSASEKLARITKIWLPLEQQK